MPAPDGKNPRALLHEAVPQPHHSFNLAPGDSEFSTETADVHIDRSGFDQAVVPPDALEQAIARQHAIAVLDQVTQQLELAPCQANRRAIDADRYGIEVGEQVLAAIDERFGAGAAVATADMAATEYGTMMGLDFGAPRIVVKKPVADARCSSDSVLSHASMKSRVLPCG